LTLSARQYRILDALGIDVWVPRSKPQSVPINEPSELKTTVARHLPPKEAPPQVSPSVATREEGPAVNYRALSLRSGGHHALIDDSIHQERAFWLDLLRSSHAFDAETLVREGRFDWPIPGLPQADAAAAQRALLGYVQADTLIWVRGDALANLLIGAGKWRSFPERDAVGQAEVWVLGSDIDLMATHSRRELWAALEARC